ncbi:translocase [Pycnococcus provasolii]
MKCACVVVLPHPPPFSLSFSAMAPSSMTMPRGIGCGSRTRSTRLPLHARVGRPVVCLSRVFTRPVCGVPVVFPVSGGLRPSRGVPAAQAYQSSLRRCGNAGSFCNSQAQRGLVWKTLCRASSDAGSEGKSDDASSDNDKVATASEEKQDSSPEDGALDLDAVEPVIPLGMDGDRPAEGGGPAEYFKGVAEEAKLIEWPSPINALTRTALVIAVVAGSAIILTGVNSILSETSKTIFS